MLQVSTAADLRLPSTTGSSVALSQLWCERPILLFFLRHFGCAICRAELLRLRNSYALVRALGAEVVAISPEDLLSTQRFAARHNLPFPVLVDSKREIYQAFGLADGSIGDVVGPRVMLRQAREALHGNIASLNPLDPIRQLGGVFIIDRNGVVRFGHVAKPIYNYPAAETYLAVLRSLQTG